MFYDGLSSRLCQLGTPRYIGIEHATPSSDPKLSGKSCHTTTRTNQYNEHIQTITLAPGQVPHRFQGGNTYVQGSSNELPCHNMDNMWRNNCTLISDSFSLVVNAIFAHDLVMTVDLRKLK